MSAADVTLNPLPSSVQWSTSLFTVRDVGTPYAMPGNAGRILYAGVGDLTGDGWPEVVISGWSYRGFDATGTPPDVPITIFSTSAAGVTQLNTQSLLGVAGSNGTAMLRVADFTGDGRNDLLMVGHNESPFVNTASTLWVANGTGFTATNVGPKVAVHEGEVGDVNGDGRLDFVASAYWAEKTFDPFFYTGNNGNYVTGQGASGGLLMLQVNQGNGAFKAYPLIFDKTIGELKTSSTPWDVTHWSSGSSAVIADLNGDGKAEVIVTDLRSSQNWNRGDSYIITDIRYDEGSAAGRLIALPTPYFEDKALYAGMQSNFPGEKSHDIQVKVMDFDNDGDQDILVFSMVWHDDTPAGIVQFLRNNGGLNFTDVTDQVLYNSYLGKGESSHEAVLMDVNGDGFVDIVSPGDPVFTATGSKTNSWSNEILINTGNGKFVSVMWNQFHTFTVQAGTTSDAKMFPYMTPDGRLGFIGTQYAGIGTEFFNVEASAKIGTGPGGIDPATRGAPGFNEAYYLTENPSVAAAVTAGQYASGLDHYLAVGRAQGLAGFAPNAIVTGGTGADTITLRDGAERAFGGAGADTIDGGAGRDFLRGEDGDDSISGGADFDDTHGNMGNDTIRGGLGDDWVVGGKDNDQLWGDEGLDIVWGNLGNDTLHGGDDRDQVRGGQGDDLIYGDGGSDYVSGDRGNDTVYGGAGADFFHGSQDQGIDRIMDFSIAEGDRVMLDPGTTYTVSQVGADVVIDTGNGNQMILVGVQLSSLTSGWIFESWTLP